MWILLTIAPALFHLASDTKDHPTDSQAPPSTAEFRALQHEVADQKALILQILQMEQQRYDVLLRLIQSGGKAEGVTFPPPPVVTSPAPPPTAHPAVKPAARNGVVTGTVAVKGGRGMPVYVYLEDVHEPAPPGTALSIVQKDKQFMPQVAAVTRGTKVLFPNADKVAHNVFSLSPQQPFDLGMTPAQDRGLPITVQAPGVLEIYCSIHGKMWTQILVVPNGHFAKADPDGRFRLAGLPLGRHTVAAWTPNAQVTRESVSLTQSPSEVHLNLTAGPPRAHNNKFGQPYGSYEE